MNLVEWLTENYVQFGASLQLITDKSSEGFQFVKGFSGLGGFMRYKMQIDFLVGGTNKEDWQDNDDDFI